MCAGQLRQQAIIGSTYPAPENSIFTHAAFFDNHRIVIGQVDTLWLGNGPCRLVCQSGFTGFIWQRAIGSGKFTQLLVSSDDIAYAAVNASAPFVVAYDSEGNFRWRYTFSTGVAPRTLTGLRIYGNKILIVGSGRLDNEATPTIVAILLDRHTGAVEYTRQYLLDGQALNSPPILRSAQGYAFISGYKTESQLGQPRPSAILKINPADGEVLGHYRATQPLGDFQVDSIGYAYTGLGSPSSFLVRVDARGSGEFPEVYRVLCQTFATMILSKGHVITCSLGSGDVIQKIRASDGNGVWFRPRNVYGASLLADQYGRLYSTFYKIGDNFAGTLDPEDGSELDSRFLNDVVLSVTKSGLTINSYGEMLYSGFTTHVFIDPWGFSHTQTRAQLHWLYQVVIPTPDSYRVLQGETLITNGNGVLSNDHYVNPDFTYADYVGGSGPAHGELLLGANGEFSYSSRENGIPVPAGPVSFRYQALRGGDFPESSATIEVVRGVRSLTMAKPSFAGVNGTVGTLTMTSSGPSAVVRLSTNNPIVTVPESVVVPSLTKTFAVRSIAEVTADTLVTIIAEHAGFTCRATVRVLPLALSATALSPKILRGGESATLRIVINGVAGPNGLTVDTSTNSPFCSIAPTATIPPGGSSVNVPVTTLAPAQTVVTLVTARYKDKVINNTLTINP